jgi:sodium-dependent dicarboxylate transporter 2/3/5
MSKGIVQKLSFTGWHKLLLILVSLIIPFALHSIRFPDAVTNAGNIVLTPAGQTVIGVLIFTLILWMTEAIPFHITGLISIFLMTILQIDSFKNIVAIGFGNHIFIFFIGVLILSSLINYSGLGKRIAIFLLSKTGNDTRTIILGFLIVGALLSMWITDMAVAAMLMPLAKSLLKEEGIKPLKSNFGKALMISCAWGPIIGGIGTPAGCGPNPIAIGFLKDMAGIDVSFIQWMTYGVPAAILLIPVAWVILIIFFKPEMKKLSKTKDELKEDLKKLPKISREEKITIIIFILTVALWLSSPLFEKWLGISIPISMPILLTSSLFFFPKISGIKWKDVERDISWSSILLIVTGISMGMMLYQTGAAGWLSVILLGGIVGMHPFVQIFAIVFIVSFLKIALSSNTVTGTIIIPIIIAFAQNHGLSVLTITLPAAITASLAFILVTSTPTNVIPYSAGYFSILDMAKAGIVMTVISSVIVSAVIFLVGTAYGLY